MLRARRADRLDAGPYLLGSVGRPRRRPPRRLGLPCAPARRIEPQTSRTSALATDPQTDAARGTGARRPRTTAKPQSCWLSAAPDLQARDLNRAVEVTEKAAALLRGLLDVEPDAGDGLGAEASGEQRHDVAAELVDWL